MMRRGVALAGVAVAILSGCGDDDCPVALIATSLRPALDDRVADVRTSFQPSGAIAAQIRQGADVDVVIVADPAIVEALRREELVDPPTTVASNALAVLVPVGNPLGIRSLADLTRPGRRLVVASRGVPLGDYTRTAIGRAGTVGLLRNVVAEEPDAGGVVGKVAQGEVDAGIGYASDLSTGRVDGFALPESAQVDVRYDAAIVSATTRRTEANAYLAWLTSAEGRDALAAAGFVVP